MIGSAGIEENKGYFASYFEGVVVLFAEGQAYGKHVVHVIKPRNIHTLTIIKLIK